MSKVKKYLGIFLCMVMVVGLLSGCMYESIETTVNPNGSGKITMVVGYEKEFMDLMNSMGGSTSIPEEDMVEKVINGKTYLIQEEEMTFESVEEFNELFTSVNEGSDSDRATTIRLDRHSDTDFTLTMEVDNPSGEKLNGLDLEDLGYSMDELNELGLEEMGLTEEYITQKVKEIVMQVVISFPTKMEKVEGPDDKVVVVEGNKVKIDLLGVPEEAFTHLNYMVKSVNSDSPVKVLSFSDVPSMHWAYKAIMKAVELGIFQGTTAPDANGVGTFAPNKSITRAEFITTMIRAIGETPVSVSGGAWYEGYIQAAINSKIITANDFDGIYDVPMTREEMAYVLNHTATHLQIALLESQDIRDKIPDWYSISELYKNSVLKCYSAGLLVGVDDKGTFSPDAPVTRASAATVIMRLLDKQG